MARKLRMTPGGGVYHVINRRVARAELFGKPEDYAAFEAVLGQAVERFGMRLLAYCLMPNHWHLLLWPRHDGQLSRFMQWLTVTHLRRWHAHRGSAGEGPVYQGRFKSFPIQEDEHFLAVCRYVERNPLRAKLVRRAQDWLWSSAARRGTVTWLLPVDALPVALPPDWLRQVNRAQTPAELEALRVSVHRGSPFGDPAWRRRTAARLGLESSLRPPWRPKKPRTEKGANTKTRKGKKET